MKRNGDFKKIVFCGFWVAISVFIFAQESDPPKAENIKVDLLQVYLQAITEGEKCGKEMLKRIDNLPKEELTITVYDLERMELLRFAMRQTGIKTDKYIKKHAENFLEKGRPPGYSPEEEWDSLTGEKICEINVGSYEVYENCCFHQLRWDVCELAEINIRNSFWIKYLQEKKGKLNYYERIIYGEMFTHPGKEILLDTGKWDWVIEKQFWFRRGNQEPDMFLEQYTMNLARLGLIEKRNVDIYSPSWKGDSRIYGEPLLPPHIRFLFSNQKRETVLLSTNLNIKKDFGRETFAALKNIWASGKRDLCFKILISTIMKYDFLSGRDYFHFEGDSTFSKKLTLTEMNSPENLKKAYEFLDEYYTPILLLLEIAGVTSDEEDRKFIAYAFWHSYPPGLYGANAVFKPKFAFVKTKKEKMTVLEVVSEMLEGRTPFVVEKFDPKAMTDEELVKAMQFTFTRLFGDIELGERLVREYSGGDKKEFGRLYNLWLTKGLLAGFWDKVSREIHVDNEVSLKARAYHIYGGIIISMIFYFDWILNNPERQGILEGETKKQIEGFRSEAKEFIPKIRKEESGLDKENFLRLREEFANTLEKYYGDQKKSKDEPPEAKTTSTSEDGRNAEENEGEGNK